MTNLRKDNQTVLVAFGARQSFAIREYWSWRCAVCDAECHPLEDAAWIPPSDPESPGIVPTNVLPLCKACSNQKGLVDPYQWLTDKLGVRRSAIKLAQIKVYFEEMSDEKTLDFWYRAGLRHSIARYFKSATQPESLLIEFSPGQDDDLLQWLLSLESNQRQSIIKVALRAFKQGVLPGMTGHRRPLSGKTRGTRLARASQRPKEH